jgi:SAM-dependent methyltransferase
VGGDADATAAWEREQLSLRPGQRLLDVGCGLGDAALTLAADLGTDGEVVGVDVSAEMVAAARRRAGAAAVPCPVRFVVGDAGALDGPDGSFDAVRSERTLQWLSAPAGAVAGMARLVRPGGRLALIDTDWSTFVLDIGDDGIARRVREALRNERRRPSNIGRRLVALVRDAGCRPDAETTATQHWTAWDPDSSPAPAGCFTMSDLADDLVDTGHLDPADRDRFVSQVHDAARHGRFSMSLTMHAVVATAP